MNSRIDSPAPGAPMAPVAPHERIAAMDVLRGFALLGILLMNIEGMAGPLMGALTGIDPVLHGADRVADALIYVFVQGKFYPLFSMLFGMGFAVMLMRAEAREVPFFGVYLRRVLALLAIGLAHALLLWSGDVLVTYALVGFVLLLFFRRTPVSRLPKWGVFMLLLFPAFLALGGLTGSMEAARPGSVPGFGASMAAQAQGMADLIEAQRQAYGGGSFAEATGQRAADLDIMLGLLPMFGSQVLGLFLVGAWFVRSGAIADPAGHAATFRRLRLAALPLGLAMVLGSVALVPAVDFGRMDLTVAAANTLFMLGGVLMSLGYLAWIVRGVTAGKAWLAALAPAGRMALSNYLAQSLVMTTLFFGYGLGYFDQLPRAWQPLLVFAFFALQVAWSRAWLARFRMGPMEWLWRAATYGRLPPMRR